MSKGILVQAHGGPEVLVYGDLKVMRPQAGQVLIRQTAIGVNYLDIYYRTGLYPVPLPMVPGSEGAGVVLEVGEGITGFKPGDRVAYAMVLGAYAEERIVDARLLVPIPEGISDETAAAMMLKGLTAQYLLRRTFKVEPGHTLLFHAAAGGVGQIVTQWAKHLGATVIGTVGSRDKEKLARENGCDHVIFYREEDFPARVAEITNGEKCDVVYDGVGKSTFSGSLDCLKPFGMFVSFGNASGPVDAFNLTTLTQKGSLYATRPSLGTHVANRDVLEAMAADLFAVVKSGAVKIPQPKVYHLAEVRKVHEALESRQTTGAIILIP